MDRNLYYLICNWKMYLTLHQAEQLTNAIIAMQQPASCQLVICPSFEALYPVANKLSTTTIKLGAQQCSSYDLGAYTGQVSALSLAAIGCSFCIIGHSEQRHYNKETDDQQAQKLIQLFKTAIMPIICIGETEQEYKQGKTNKILEQQLHAFIATLQQEAFDTKKLYIAYEPRWAIGTGLLPTTEQLTTTYAFIKEYIKTNAIAQEITLLYGGSITSTTMAPLLTVPAIQGFLIGKASTDVQELKKIIATLN